MPDYLLTLRVKFAARDDVEARESFSLERACLLVLDAANYAGPNAAAVEGTVRALQPHKAPRAIETWPPDEDDGA